MPGFYPREPYPDEMDQSRDWKIRRDEENAAAHRSTATLTAAPSQEGVGPGDDVPAAPVRPAFVIAFLLVLFGVVGSSDADDEEAIEREWRARQALIYQPAVPETFPPECTKTNSAGEKLTISVAQRSDKDVNWEHYCGYEPDEEGTRL